MSAQLLTLSVPERIYSRLERRAQQTNRTVEAELLELLAGAVTDSHDMPADLSEAVTALAFLEDEALWKTARSVFPAHQAAELEELHLKRQREGLTQDEVETAARLVRQYERALLLRAESARLLRERGYDISELARS